MDLSLLYKLQHFHKEEDVIIKRLKELHEHKEMRKLKEEYQRLRNEYEMGEERKKKNLYQQEVNSNEIKNLDSSKKSSEAIKFSRETDTVKKLESIEKQIEKLDTKRQAAENGIIALKSEADNIDKELIEIKRRMIFIKKKYMNIKEETDKEMQELENRKSKLDPEIEELMGAIGVESYEIYKRMKKSHLDPVAKVEKNICSGCKMEVPAMDFQALKNGSQQVRCQNCGRLLFYCKV